MDQIIFGPNYILLKTLDFGSNYFLDQMSRTESWTKLFLDQIILDQIIPVYTTVQYCTVDYSIVQYSTV